MAMSLKNPSHPEHELELKKYLKSYTCDGCKEIGFGPRYRCEICDFDLHEDCMFPQSSLTSHEFFPGSTFKFYNTPPEACCHYDCKRNCDACRKPINGFVYHCEKHDLDLHPCCRNLKQSYRIEDVEFNLHKKVQGKCMWCKNKSISSRRGHKTHNNSWSYISGCGKYHIHVACVTDMVLEEWNKNGGKRINVDNQNQELALHKVNLQAIQARGRRMKEGGIKFGEFYGFLLIPLLALFLEIPP